ncbi:hypothetical protein ACHWQZ_G012378 [Mnemiopsis leidyi]
MSVVVGVVVTLDILIILLNILMAIHLKKARKGIARMLLSYLAVYDLCVGTIILPMRISSLIMDRRENNWPLGKLGCVLYGIATSMTVRSTMWTIVLLAIDRVAAVLAPFSYATRTKVWYGKAAGAAVIFYSSVMVVIMSTTTKQYIRKDGKTVCLQSFRFVYASNTQHFFLFHRLVEFLSANLIVMVLSLATITKLLSRRRQRIQRIIRRVEQNLTCMVVFLLLAFLVCYLPFTFYLSITMIPNKILSVGNEIEVTIGQAVMTLLTINNLLNPLVYLLFTAREAKKAESKRRSTLLRLVQTKSAAVRRSLSMNTSFPKVGPEKGENS